MNRLYISALVLVLLLSQWGSLDHVHDYTEAEACEYCLSAHALDHAITPTTQNVFAPATHQIQLEFAELTVSRNIFRYYSVRAPPRFI